MNHVKELFGGDLTEIIFEWILDQDVNSVKLSKYGWVL
jgi:hypothetical protein